MADLRQVLKGGKEMAWKTPKTDWTVDDGISAEDLRRIEGNTLDNHERIGKIQNGTTKVPNASNADKLLSGLRNVSVIMGTISSGNTLPLPSGFSESECFWIVSINSLDTHIYNNEQASTRTQCYVDGSRTVHITATRSSETRTGTANYLVIGVKK